MNDEKCHKDHKSFPCCEDQMCSCDYDEFQRLIAENTRLREALREVSSETLIYNGVPEFERIGDIARNALEGK